MRKVAQTTRKAPMKTKKPKTPVRKVTHPPLRRRGLSRGRSKMFFEEKIPAARILFWHCSNGPTDEIW
jgi:hypothetical protein